MLEELARSLLTGARLRALIKRLLHNLFIESLRLSTELAARGLSWPPEIMKFRDFPKNPKKCVFRKKRDIASGDHVVGGLGLFGRKNFMQNLRNVKKCTSLDENLVYFSLR